MKENTTETSSDEIEATTSKEQRHGKLVFAVNGERFELPSVDPSTTLLEFLRGQTCFKSVKLSCGEGGCGACVVLLSKYNQVLEQVENFTVSSCLTLLCSINGCSITTSEGLGNSKDGFHPIHQRFSGFHASQCGFCTPGMCMSLFSSLINAEKTDRPTPPEGFSKLTVSEAEKAIAGNLCRCTGYRPIADACKSFAADVDVEDLGLNCFWKKGESRDVKVSRLPRYHPSDKVCTFPDFLKTANPPTLSLDCKSYSWQSPVTVQELVSLLKSSVAENSSPTRVVVGNTGTGYYKELACYDRFIDLRYIPELSTVRSDQTGLIIGAAVTISNVISTLRREVHSSNLSSDNKVVFDKLADHMEKIASGFIRNSASIGGNLVMAQRKSFPSDVATLLLGVGSNVSIVSMEKLESITLEEFLERPPLDSKSVLLTIQIPFWGQKTSDNLSGTGSRLMFETYRAAPRPEGSALAFLNAAFLADVSTGKNGVLVNDIRLAFGAYGTKHAIRAKNVEEYLTGKVITIGVLYEALKLVKEAIVPEEGTSHPFYRSSLAVSFLFEFFHQSIHMPGTIEDSLCEDVTNSSAVPASKTENSTLLLPAKQVLESSEEYYPVGQPKPKFLSALQASGEAVYVDDIPSPPNCLYGAFIYSTKPLARVTGINFNSVSPPDGITAVITYKDIPIGGANIGSRTSFDVEVEPLFADELARCAGDRIALVVANTQKCADMAANLALIDYDTDGLDPPILTVEEAVERSSFFEIPPSLRPKPVGDVSKGMAESDHKILSAKIKLGSQYFFYMETQTALAVPDEDNCLVVYSSSQRPEYTQITIAECLGIPEHNVRVITRRVGGGFGGKLSKSMPVAIACSLAAHKLRRPVRMYLNRKTDMIMTGGRHPMQITYSVGFKSSGKITAVDLNILIDSGIVADFGPWMPTLLIDAFKKYDWGSLSFDIKVCKTNNPSRTMMRAPGHLQGSYIAEAIIEHVASTLQMDVDSVRSKNLHTFESLSKFYDNSAGDKMEYTLPTLWDKIARSSNFFQRCQLIEQFNNRNRWRKRGISRVPIVFGVSLNPRPGKVSILWDGSIVVEVGGIELGQGLWTKVKQVTAYALGLIQCDGTQDLSEKVRVIQADTLSQVQGGMTGGSTTSESSCEAVRLCCNVLVERLAPIREQIRAETDNVTWNTLILQAHLKNIDLSASTYFVPDDSSTTYLNYGAAVTEVEVDILTGQTKILQADIIYDCGKSMNPAVDLGQIEGSFVKGIGFFMLEEFLTSTNGLVVTDSTWTYKIPTIDTIPKQFNVEIMNSGHHQKRILSSKASGEPPLLLAVSVHCATRAAIVEARKQLKSWSNSHKLDYEFQLAVPATMPVVKSLCGLDVVEKYLESLLTGKDIK